MNDGAGRNESSSQALARFAAGLQYEDLPADVRSRALDLFVDWAGAAFAGAPARAVQTIAAFSRIMGPPTGPSEVLIDGSRTSPYFAAMVNAAASHIAEQDDLHNGSVFHPGTVVFPPALAVAQAIGASGHDLLTAGVAGYEVGIRLGEFLGRSHYKTFHTTGTAGTVAAAVAAGRLLKLNPGQMLNAIGSAGTQAAGLWEFLRDAADSKQLHTAHAAAAGLASAYLAQDGFAGAKAILEGSQGMGAAMSRDAEEHKLTDGLGRRWALTETSFKYHASCRHTHPAADALLQAIRTNSLQPDNIVRVVAQVHQGAIDVLGSVGAPQTIHQAKFSMGSVLGLIAHGGTASLSDFEGMLDRDDVARFRDKVEMTFDSEVDAAYPKRWIGKVIVEMNDGRRFSARVEDPKGDPTNTLTHEEITEKAKSLITFGGRADAAALVHKLWGIGDLRRVEGIVV